MREKLVLAALFAIGLAGVGFVVLTSGQDGNRADANAAYSVPDSPGMTVEVAFELFHKLTPSLLLVVYQAFEETQEDARFDALARVSHGEARDYFYRQGVEEMKGGGLVNAARSLHEIELLSTKVRRKDNSLVLDAAWQVIGNVEQSEHVHVRGNTYSADLTISPVEGAWRITEFELRGVNSDTAGETFAVPETN